MKEVRQLEKIKSKKEWKGRRGAYLPSTFKASRMPVAMISHLIIPPNHHNS